MHFNIAQIGKKGHKVAHAKSFLVIEDGDKTKPEHTETALRVRKPSRFLSRETSDKDDEPYIPVSPEGEPNKIVDRPKDPVLIAQQAIEELEESQKAWEEDFKAWGLSWRKCIDDMSFDRVRDAAWATPRLDLDPEIISLISPPTSHPTRAEDNNGDTESIDSVNAGIADVYHSYTSRGQSTDGSTELLTTPHVPKESEYEISIIDDDLHYADFTGDFSNSKPASRGEMHAYHQLLS